MQKEFATLADEVISTEVEKGVDEGVKQGGDFMQNAINSEE
jgi:hypothetical protein